MIPRGPGVATRRLRIAEADVVKLGCALSGYDHFVSVHGDGRDIVVLVTTESQVALLDEVLAGLRPQLHFEIVRE